jgi:FkbM family methyltransferase
MLIDTKKIIEKEFVSLLEKYSPLDIGRKMNIADGFFLYRILLRRNPKIESELKEIVNFEGTYREFFSSIVESEEFSNSSSMLLPPGQCWMAVIDNIRFWFRTSDREMGSLMALGRYEQESVNLIKKIVKPGMTCIDAGANTGFYSVIMGANVGKSGKVYAFEPMPENYEMLVKNVNENRMEDIISHYQLGCSSSHSIVDAMVISNMYVVGEQGNGKKVKMQTVRVDDYLNEKVDLIKIDVEGHEKDALEGMHQIIRTSRPIIISEINEYWLRTCSNSNGKDYLEYLNALGYKVFNVNAPDIKLRANNFSMDILETMDIIAKPIS